MTARPPPVTPTSSSPFDPQATTAGATAPAPAPAGRRNLILAVAAAGGLGLVVLLRSQAQAGGGSSSGSSSASTQAGAPSGVYGPGFPASPGMGVSQLGPRTMNPAYMWDPNAMAPEPVGIVGAGGFTRPSAGDSTSAWPTPTGGPPPPAEGAKAPVFGRATFLPGYKPAGGQGHARGTSTLLPGKGKAPVLGRATFLRGYRPRGGQGKARGTTSFKGS